MLPSCSYPLWHYIKVSSIDFGFSCEDLCTLYKLVIRWCEIEYKCLDIFPFDLCFRTYNKILKVAQLFDEWFLMLCCSAVSKQIPRIYRKAKGKKGQMKVCKKKKKRWSFLIFHLTVKVLFLLATSYLWWSEWIIAGFLLYAVYFYLSSQFHNCYSPGKGF